EAGEQRPDVLREADCHQPAPCAARLAQCRWLAIWPPSTCRISPVMYGDDSKNRTPFTTSLTCPARPSGGSRPPSASELSTQRPGAWMMRGKTALTGMPRQASSMASDRVAAARPPLVSAASTDGAQELATSARVAQTLTT